MVFGVVRRGGVRGAGGVCGLFGWDERGHGRGWDERGHGRVRFFDITKHSGSDHPPRTLQGSLNGWVS